MRIESRQGGSQVQSLSIRELLFAKLFQRQESASGLKVNFSPFAVDQGNAFPPSLAAGFVLCSRWPFQCSTADVYF